MLKGLWHESKHWQPLISVFYCIFGSTDKFSPEWLQATAAMNKMFPELKEPVDEKVMTEAATVLAPNVLPAGKGSWGHMDITRYVSLLHLSSITNELLPVLSLKHKCCTASRNS